MRCNECDVELKSGEENTFSNGIFCRKCYDVLKENERQRRMLIVFIQDFFGIDRPTNMMFGQMKNFYEGGISYKNQRMTLEYMRDVEGTNGRNLDTKWGISLIKTKHQDMLDYWKRKLRAREQVKKQKEKQLETKTVVIKQKKNRQSDYSKRKMINMENL